MAGSSKFCTADNRHQGILTEEGATTAVFDMPEEELDIVKEFVNYIYASEYNDLRLTPRTESDDKSVQQNEWTYSYALFFNTKMYVFAERYDVGLLKVLAAQKYKKHLATQWETFKFLEAAKWLWENTMDRDTTLKDAVADCMSHHIDALMKKKEFREMMPPSGSIADAVLYAAVQRMPGPSHEESLLGSAVERARRSRVASTMPPMADLGWQRP